MGFPFPCPRPVDFLLSFFTFVALLFVSFFRLDPVLKLLSLSLLNMSSSSSSSTSGSDDNEA